MTKKVKTILKFQIEIGKTTPALSIEGVSECPVICSLIQ